MSAQRSELLAKEKFVGEQLAAQRAELLAKEKSVADDVQRPVQEQLAWWKSKLGQRDPQLVRAIIVEHSKILLEQRKELEFWRHVHFAQGGQSDFGERVKFFEDHALIPSMTRLLLDTSKAHNQEFDGRISRFLDDCPCACVFVSSFFHFVCFPLSVVFLFVFPSWRTFTHKQNLFHLFRAPRVDAANEGRIHKAKDARR